jgi:hypothetical protein
VKETIPELHYWLAGPPLFVAASFVLPTLLALLAIREMQSLLARVLFGVAAIGVMSFGWWQSANQEKANAESSIVIATIADVIGLKPGVPTNRLIDVVKSQKELFEALTGGNNFGFFSAVTHRFDNEAKVLQLQINGTGGIQQVQYWISPASANRNPDDQAYWSIDKPKTPMVIGKGSFWFGRALPLGSYFVEFSSPYQAWVERFDIVELGGNFKQSIIVTRDGKQIYSTNGLVDESAIAIPDH